ncbi:NAD(P)/FAD-dependent oxidoreductase [Rhodoplanes roseus]|uniref:NAD(P)/FAD-dependent oxidoreductase n=1 Tax=Rhodoplanes roseus TaxID=29409 RepID=UPI001AED092A|nr:NAD(P)/FAD-dependent oxidoreductase [Rhodoplanes roseus]
MAITRRGFSIAALAGAGMLAVPAVLRAQAKPRLVVIGGGPAGATVAKYVAKDSNGAIDVTLVEPLQKFLTCFHSNLYVGGFKPWDALAQDYKLAAYGVKKVDQAASAIDRDKKQVRLADGSVLPYDRLVVAPGIDLDFASVPGWSAEAAEIMPHAWKVGPQTQLLKKQLDGLEDGATIVMIAPPNPYRCPPGPYERVSCMAHILKTKGHSKSRIVIIDPKDRFSKMALFQEGWQNHYPGMVEWMDPKMHGGLKNVDPKAMTVTTDLETIKADLVNVIPKQMAGRIARDAGLANASGFCPIDPASMKSAQDPSVFVLGDAAIAGAMPKSAFAANSQAKVVAMAVRGELTGSRTFPARYANTCWSILAPDDTVKVGGRYEAKDGAIAEVEGFVSKTGETADLRRQTSEENMGWYSGIVADIFG